MSDGLTETLALSGIVGEVSGQLDEIERAYPAGCAAAMLEVVEELRRPSDGELCGYVERRDGRWHALTVFGADLGSHDGRNPAADHVLERGLASLAQRWTLRHGATGEEEVVCIQEVDGTGVTVALGYYSLPGVPTRTITRDELTSGEWELRL